MSGRNARLVRRIAFVARGEGRTEIPMRIFKRWFRSLDQDGKATSRRTIIAIFKGPRTSRCG